MHLDQFRDSLKGLAPATERLTMTIEEQLSAAGEARGIVKGEASGLVKGEARGIVKGEARGIVKGAAEAKAGSVLLVFGARGLHVDEAEQRRIEACVDVEQLDHWLKLAVTVAAVEDIFEG